MSTKDRQARAHMLERFMYGKTARQKEAADAQAKAAEEEAKASRVSGIMRIFSR